MSKRAIAEPIPYTAEELDILHKGIGAAVSRPVYEPQDVIQEMVLLATKLEMLLLAEGLPCTYSACTLEYRQVLDVHLPCSDDPHSVVLHPTSVYSGYKPINSIRELIPHLHELESRYLQCTLERLRWCQILDQCRRCHYSDKEVEYCGKGLERVLRCRGYKGPQLEDSVYKMYQLEEYILVNLIEGVPLSPIVESYEVHLF